MKKLALLILLFIPFNLYAGCDGVNCVCVTKECKADRDIIRMNHYCGGETQKKYKTLWMAGNEDGERVFYIFEIEGGDIRQVGIIDEPAEKIYHVSGLKKTPESYSWCIVEDGIKTCDKNLKKEYLNSKFPDSTPLKYYRK